MGKQHEAPGERRHPSPVKRTEASSSKKLDETSVTEQYEHERSSEQADQHGQQVPYDESDEKKTKPIERNLEKQAKIRKRGKDLRD